MELKSYQKEVIADLARYLELVVELQSPAKAYQALWNEKNVLVGFGGMPDYVNVLPGVPHVCAKVPTGGGKTYIAASSLRTIFDAIPQRRAKAVVWLVPSEAILTQTRKALENPAHPYRQRLDVDFGGRVQVYSKEQALMGQNFTPSAVTEQLSLFVLSYDSFRTSKKEGRKAYQENGYLAEFAKWMDDPSVLLADTDETALIQVIRYLNPVVIVDESHHARSKLSLDMLRNLNPRFVLELTATPARGANVIAQATARQLKREEMVKLPVVVYRRPDKRTTIADAVTLQRRLERIAVEDEKRTGRYIRPIVLFQAERRGVDDAETYAKLKQKLVEGGIPEEQIAVRTGDVDEIGSADLMSRECPIRFIITVEALAEGWDCPSVDCVVVLRPTKVRSLYSQMVGRGTRLSPGKTDLLLLDFLWMTDKHELCRPADLVCEDRTVARQMTEHLAETGCPEDIEEAAAQASEDVVAQREEALAKQLEEQRRKKAKLVDPLQYEMSIQAEDLSGYVPAFGWEAGPPSAEQTAALEKMGTSMDYAIDVDVPDENIINRMAGRRACLECGATYHLVTIPTKVEGICDVCGSKVVLRDDDKPETVQKRLEVYHAQTQPLIDYYKKQNILKTVDGTQPMDTVFGAIVDILGA